jgi:hypothetical protein
MRFHVFIPAFPKPISSWTTIILRTFFLRSISRRYVYSVKETHIYYFLSVLVYDDVALTQSAKF